jgi:hypothetical protein
MMGNGATGAQQRSFPQVFGSTKKTLLHRAPPKRPPLGTALDLHLACPLASTRRLGNHGPASMWAWSRRDSALRPCKVFLDP